MLFDEGVLEQSSDETVISNNYFTDDSYFPSRSKLEFKSTLQARRQRKKRRLVMSEHDSSTENTDSP